MREGECEGEGKREDQPLLLLLLLPLRAGGGEGEGEDEGECRTRIFCTRAIAGAPVAVGKCVVANRAYCPLLVESGDRCGLLLLLSLACMPF